MIEYKKLGWTCVSGPSEHTEEITISNGILGDSTIIKGIYGFDTVYFGHGLVGWMTEKELLEYKEFKINKYKEEIEAMSTRDYPEAFPYDSFMGRAKRNLEYWNDVEIQYEELDYTPERVPCPNPF